MNRYRQAGDVLLESLVGVLLTTVVGAGLAHVTANLLEQKRELKLTGAALTQMRGLLEERGESMCSGGPYTLPIAERVVDVRVTCEDGPTITVQSSAGTAFIQSPKRITLSVDPDDLGVSSGARIELGNGQ